MFILIENGEVYAPQSVGVTSILLLGDKIARLGEIEGAKLRATGLECDIIDATGCVVIPGLVDPHQHLIGAAGETGFASRTSEVPFSHLLRCGITTVVGCLGTDTTTRHLTSLLAKAKQINTLGLSAYIYTGGFQVPTPTLTGAIMDDLILFEEVIGVGEIAISDVRSVEPTLDELARLVSAALVGGMVGGKAGVTHFHIGPGKHRLALLNALLDNYEIPAAQIYPTHISRSPELMDEAIALAKRGAYVDIDTVEAGLGQWLRYYQKHGGDWSHLTVSSDAHTAEGSPFKLYQEFVSAVKDYELPLAEVLELFTQNPAIVLKLANKGRLEAGRDADVLILKKDSLELLHLFARGRWLVKDGQVQVKEQAEELASQ